LLSDSVVLVHMILDGGYNTDVALLLRENTLDCYCHCLKDMR
jgi:hypothetical protein